MPSDMREREPEAKRRFSQNFLRDPDILARIGEAARELAGDAIADTVCVEIGPGTGQLTEALRTRGLRVAAVEADPRMKPVLEQRFGSWAEHGLVLGDARDTDLRELVRSVAGTSHPPVIGVSNLPYQYTTPLITKYFVSFPDARGFLFMVQRDAVSRLRSVPGEKGDLKRRGPVRILGEVYGTAEVLCRVPAAAFDPPPRVASAVLRFRPHAGEMRARYGFFQEAPAFFAAYLEAAFTQRRRTLANNFKLDAAARGHGFGNLSSADEQRLAARFAETLRARPEALPAEAHLALAEAIYEARRDGEGGPA